MTNLIFDYDGTLHNCLKIYEPSFRMAYKWLTDNGYCDPHEYTDKEIGYWLGFNSEDMWSMFQPQLDREIREKCRRLIGAEMKRHIECGDAELFKGAEKTLDTLKNNGYTLIFSAIAAEDIRSATQLHLALTDILTFFIAPRILILFRNMRFSVNSRLHTAENILLSATAFTILKQL